MPHGLHPIMYINTGMPVINERLEINNYNCQQPPFVQFGSRFYNSNYGNNPDSIFYRTAGNFALGYMIGNVGTGIGLFDKIKNWFNDLFGKHNDSTVEQQNPDITPNDEISAGQNKIDKSEYSSTISKPISNMRNATTSHDLLMAINDASIVFTDLNKDITSKTADYNKEYKKFASDDYAKEINIQKDKVKTAQNALANSKKQQDTAQANYNKAVSDAAQAKSYLNSINSNIDKINSDLSKDNLTDETRNILNNNLATLTKAKQEAEKDLETKENLLNTCDTALNIATSNTTEKQHEFNKQQDILNEMNDKRKIALEKKSEIEKMENDRNKLDQIISNQQERLERISKREQNKINRLTNRANKNDEKGNENRQTKIQERIERTQANHVDV